MTFKWSFLKKLLNKDTYSDTAMIAWPVVYTGPFPPRDPHVTIFYFADVTKNPEWEEALIDAIKSTPFDVFPRVEVKGLALFGPEQNVAVLEIESPFLKDYYDTLKSELESRNLPFDTTFPDYKPHVTISNEAYEAGIWPKSFTLKPVRLWWRKTQRIIIAKH